LTVASSATPNRYPETRRFIDGRSARRFGKGPHTIAQRALDSRAIPKHSLHGCDRENGTSNRMAPQRRFKSLRAHLAVRTEQASPPGRR
jgi:hypothetical protein